MAHYIGLLRAANWSTLARIQRLELEVIRDSCSPLYIGQAKHLEVGDFLRKNGFILEGWRFHGHTKCEGTGFFHRNNTFFASKELHATLSE